MYSKSEVLQKIWFKERLFSQTFSRRLLLSNKPRKCPFWHLYCVYWPKKLSFWKQFFPRVLNIWKKFCFKTWCFVKFWIKIWRVVKSWFKVWFYLKFSNQKMYFFSSKTSLSELSFPIQHEYANCVVFTMQDDPKKLIFQSEFSNEFWLSKNRFAPQTDAL